MLYKPIDANHPIRVQGAFISDAEVERLVNFAKEQQEVNYNEDFDPGEIVENNTKMSSTMNEDGHDEYFEEAKAFVIEQQKASTSMIQRQFRTGYNRAMRIMEELEEAQIIGPQVSTRPREVLIKPSEQELLEGQFMATTEVK